MRGMDKMVSNGPAQPQEKDTKNEADEEETTRGRCGPKNTLLYRSELRSSLSNHFGPKNAAASRGACLPTPIAESQSCPKPLFFRKFSFGRRSVGRLPGWS